MNIVSFILLIIQKYGMNFYSSAINNNKIKKTKTNQMITMRCYLFDQKISVLKKKLFP